MSWVGKAILAGLGIGVGAASQNPKVQKEVQAFFDDLSAAAGEVGKEVRNAIKEGAKKVVAAIEAAEVKEAKVAKPQPAGTGAAPANPGASA